MLSLTQNRCQICANAFKRKRYRWVINDQKAWVCPACNSRLEKRASAAAFGSQVDWPPVRKPDTNPLLVGVLLVVGFGGCMMLRTKPAEVQEAASPTLAAKAPASAPEPPRVPVFRNPNEAVEIPIRLGLASTAAKAPHWRSHGDGWYSLASLITFHAGDDSTGKPDNSITCMHSSPNAQQIVSVRWTANVFDDSPQGTSTTLPRFKKLALKYCGQLGCPFPTDLFHQVDPAKGQRLETVDAVFELRRNAYKVGHGWDLVITSK